MCSHQRLLHQIQGILGDSINSQHQLCTLAGLTGVETRVTICRIPPFLNSFFLASHFAPFSYSFTSSYFTPCGHALRILRRAWHHVVVTNFYTTKGDQEKYRLTLNRQHASTYYQGQMSIYRGLNNLNCLKSRMKMFYEFAYCHIKMRMMIFRHQSLAE